MKKCVSAGVLVCLGLLLSAGCSPKSAPEGSSVKVASPAELTIKAPDETTVISLQVVLPEGWVVNPDFGTLVYEPANRGDFSETPQIEIITAVEGETSPEAIPGNIARHMQGIKDGAKAISTGNAELDARGAIVEAVESGDPGFGWWLLVLKVTYPEGVSEAMYPPRHWIYHYLHRAGEPFFVLVKGMVPIKLADQFLDPVLDACKSAERIQ